MAQLDALAYSGPPGKDYEDYTQFGESSQIPNVSVACQELQPPHSRGPQSNYNAPWGWTGPTVNQHALPGSEMAAAVSAGPIYDIPDFTHPRIL